MSHMTRLDLQSNHRSWGDFFLDVVATEGYAQMLSRYVCDQRIAS